jgi:hypothetical protein
MLFLDIDWGLEAFQQILLSSILDFLIIEQLGIYVRLPDSVNLIIFNKIWEKYYRSSF